MIACEPMDIFLINLARATERRTAMAAQFEALGIPYSLIIATDGRSLSNAERTLVDHEKRKRITPYPLTDNEVGCWLSHRRAMQQLIDSGRPMAVVIEDDAVMSNDFPQVIAAIETCGVPFDIIDLHRNFKRNEIFMSCHNLLPGQSLGRIGYTHMKTTAYVVSQEGAQTFFAVTPRLVHAVDKEMHRYWANGLNIYGLEKPIATEDPDVVSYIDETRGQDRPAERLRYPNADGLKWGIIRPFLSVWCGDPPQPRMPRH
jgi:glycosyl transferase family 25